MDTSQFVSQAEPFLQELEREFYLVGAGRKDQLQVAPIYDRYPLLFSHDAVQARVREHSASPQSTTARYLASFAVDGYLEDRVKLLSEEITNAELLELDVTVLVPAALENQIGDWNAASIKAKIVAELANGPTTPEADEILYKNGVYVIPDFLCNAGGVTVSYFEQVQNAYDYYWDEKAVHERLDQKMTAAFHAVHEMAQRHKVHNRLAAYLVAVNRVAEVVRLRGWV